MQASSTPNHRTAQIICGALMSGVIVFWAAAFALVAGQGPIAPDLTDDPLVLLAVVIVISLGAFAGALFFKSRALSPSSDPSRVDGPAALQTHLIIAWGLLEGQALLAGVFFLLTAVSSMLIISGLVYLLGFAITFPRAEWFERLDEPASTPP